MANRPKAKRRGSANRKEQLLQIRLSATEKEAFEEAANLTGLALSAWVRERLRKVAAGELQSAGREVAFLQPAIRRRASSE